MGRSEVPPEPENTNRIYCTERGRERERQVQEEIGKQENFGEIHLNFHLRERVHEISVLSINKLS